MIRNAFTYLGSSIVNKAAPFLLLPFLTRFLGPAEFGALSIFLVINGLFFAVIGMGIHTNISKNFFASSRSELAVLIGNMLFVLGAGSLLILLLCLGVALTTEQFLSIPAELWLVFPILSFMMMVNTINLTLLRNEGKAYVYAGFEVSNTSLSVAVTVILLAGFNFGWYSQVVGLLVANTVFFVVALLSIWRRGYLKFSVRKGVIQSILQLSLPLIPHALGGVVIAVSDRIFIERMVGLEAVALYSIGYSFGMIVGLFIDAFVKAWTPWFFKVLQVPVDKVKRDVVRYTYGYFAGVFVLAGVIALVSVIILPYVVHKSFSGAVDYIFWISMGCAVQGVYKIFFPYLVYINETSFLAVSTVLSAIINLILNYVFIQYFGAIGAAYSTLFSYALSAVLVFHYQSRRFPMPWAFWKAIRP
ncbi:oligosaccharide flippase family protein [Porticoccus litoralis]|uniref:Oligosaccharide flippase family protein n=1 Tax=Porticoccus litoralis TaxID=434086 RepID=A0AAW8B7H1_9GAMM|nr:oligosaccharide flippase family protein [Porticoccus litoralis]MDP1521030.1 oligosaccharide flippase family protein [Porticoccus litoralis]